MKRRSFLAKIFSSAIAAPAVAGIIERGISKPLPDTVCVGVTGCMEGGGSMSTIDVEMDRTLDGIADSYVGRWDPELIKRINVTIRNLNRHGFTPHFK